MIVFNAGVDVRAPAPIDFRTIFGAGFLYENKEDIGYKYKGLITTDSSTFEQWLWDGSNWQEYTTSGGGQGNFTPKVITNPVQDNQLLIIGDSSYTIVNTLVAVNGIGLVNNHDIIDSSDRFYRIESLSGDQTIVFGFPLEINDVITLNKI